MEWWVNFLLVIAALLGPAVTIWIFKKNEKDESNKIEKSILDNIKEGLQSDQDKFRKDIMKALEERTKEYNNLRNEFLDLKVKYSKLEKELEETRRERNDLQGRVKKLEQEKGGLENEVRKLQAILNNIKIKKKNA